MGCIFIEIFDVKVLYAIFLMDYISRQYGIFIKIDILFYFSYILKKKYCNLPPH